MAFWRNFHTSFYSGHASSSVAVGTRYDIAIAGRGYMIDKAAQGDMGYGFASIPLVDGHSFQRSSGFLGERTLNVEDYWRRSSDTYHLGAGQLFADHDDSDASRYRASKGCDPWTKGQVGMLNDTFLRTTSANTNLALEVAGIYLYLLDGNALKYLTDISFGSSGETTVTADGTSGALSSPTSITSDGANVWVVDGTRTNYTARGTATFGKFHTADHPATLVKNTKGRLLTAGASSSKHILYTHTLTAGSAVATAYFTHPAGADWTWTAIEGGPAAIYFAGYAGDKSAIYRTAVTADGTSLAVPSVAAELPTGEIVRSLFADLSVLCIGTDKGVRIAQMNDDGSLVLGALITTAATYCFTGQDRFAWFGYSNYDATSTGLGRLDLASFNGTTPAYATDLMATTQGAVLSATTFSTKRAFVVSGHGLYVEDTTHKVATATLYTGWFNVDLADPKIAVKFAAQYRPGAGSFTLSLAVDGSSTYTQAGGTTTTTSTSGSDVILPIAQTVGREFESLLTLTRSGTDATQGPIVSRVTLMVHPAPDRRYKITVPILLHRSVQLRGGNTVKFDPDFERSQIVALMESGQIVGYQEQGGAYSVTVDDFRWIPYAQVGITSDPWNGTLVTTMKVIN